jgi:hypothetical protein
MSKTRIARFREERAALNETVMIWTGRLTSPARWTSRRKNCWDWYPRWCCAAMTVSPITSTAAWRRA